MKKLESTFLNMFLVLTLISVIAGAGLAAVYNVTKEPIEQANIAKQQAAIKAVLPEGAEVGEEVMVGDNRVFPATLNDAFGGMAIEVNTNGFGGNVKMMVGFDANGALVDYSVLEMAETPGLGSKMTDWFRTKSDIRGALIADGEVKVSKDGGKYDAITAATISSRAFMTGINNAMATYTEAAAQFQCAEAPAGEETEEVVVSDSIKTEEATL